MDKYELTITVAILFIAILFVNCTRAEKPHNATRTDLTGCKLTHFGTEYQGQKGTTGGGIRCQFWHTEDPMHKVSTDISDNDFPERSMRLAKNYCRNPTRDPKGPWCYTMEPMLIDDECGIPLCNYGECRISGTGAEYGGSKKISTAGKKCKSWDNRHKLSKGRTEKFSNKKFPELSRTKANTFCRNPNDDVGGPWCYVEEESFETVVKEYCDIPFCDDKDCLVYVRNASVYSTITKLNDTYGNITLWVKLWNPMDQQNAEARLLLSLLPIPTSAKKIAQDWRAGVEIVMSNTGSGQVYPNAGDEQDFESTPNVILGSKWTGFWINWGGGFLSVGLYGSTKPLFMDEYKKRKTISSLYPDSFLYYGLMGTGVLWSTEFCQEACEVHTTFGMEYLRVWPLQPSNTTYDIRFNVRASKDIAIRLYQSPGTLFPCFTITIGHADTITLVYQESEKSTKQHLKDVPGKSMLDFWSWKDFTLSIFGPHLRLFSERIYGNEEILYLKDNLFGTIRWFSVGSINNIAMWTFFCLPEGDPVEDPSPPNCIANLADYNYAGSQWTSINEMPCTPWTSAEIPDDDQKDDSFIEGASAKALNKCRNPSHDPNGPYCYSLSLENSLTSSKQYCPIRSCRSSECRMAGTGNDYVGTLSITRSGRKCAEWMSDWDFARLEGEKNATEEIDETKEKKKPKKTKTTTMKTTSSRIKTATIKTAPTKTTTIKTTPSTTKTTTTKTTPRTIKTTTMKTTPTTKSTTTKTTPSTTKTTTMKTTPSTTKTTTTKTTPSTTKTTTKKTAPTTKMTTTKTTPSTTKPTTMKTTPSTTKTTTTKTTPSTTKTTTMKTSPSTTKTTTMKTSPTTTKTTSTTKATETTTKTSPPSTASTFRIWRVQDFLTRHQANVSITFAPMKDDWLSKMKADTTKSKVTETTTPSTTTITTTMMSSPSTASSFRMWRVQDFLTLHKANISVTFTPMKDNWESKLQTIRPADRQGRKSHKPIHAVNPRYFNDTLYPEHSVRNASNYCRDPSRNIAGTWCYTTDPLVPQDLCDVRDCDMPEECTFLVRGQGVGRRLYVLPEHRAEGLDFSLKAWEPDQPDSITFVFTADDGLKSRYILKVGAVDNEKVILYYQGEEGGIEMVKKKTLPHLLYLGKWSSFVIKIPRGHVLVYYQGAPNPLFEWDHPEPAKAFLPIYYYYTSELGHTIGVAFNCATRCHIENTQTEKFSRILPLSIWSKNSVSNPNRLELMIRAEGVVLIPLLLFPGTPGYYAITLGESRQWIFFVKNTYPNVRIYHKQKAPSTIFTTNSWTNITLMWFNSTIDVLWNETLVFHYEHTHPLLFYYFSLGVDPGGWATWAANCIPSDIDGDPEDGGWGEWGPWACSASCNGGVGTRKRACDNPQPNVKGEPCLGPNVMSGRCNTIACGDITEDTVSLIKRRIRRNHTALSVKEDHEITIPADLDIIKAIKTESPDSEIEWSHNGIFVYPDNDRLEIEEHNIVIKRARVNDSGVYTITLHRVDGTHMIFKMATLVVYPVKSVITLRETLPMTVSCHCIVLGYLYSDLKISWTIAQKLWKNYGTTLPISVNVDIVPALNNSHKGLWECIVEQDDLGFKWTTNAILVNVIGPPNWRTHLMEDEFTKPIFGWMPNETFVAVSALVIFVILTVCIVVGTGIYTRFRESGKYRDATKKPDNAVPNKSNMAKTSLKGRESQENKNDDEPSIDSPKKRKKSAKFRIDENSEQRKLMSETDTDDSP